MPDYDLAYSSQAAEILQIALKREYDWHECQWDFAMDEARECSARKERGAEMIAMRSAKTHSVRMKQIQAAFEALKNLKGPAK